MPDRKAKSSFGPHDPLAVRPENTPGLPPSSITLDEEALPGLNEKIEEGFDPKYAEALHGLMYVGSLSHSFEWIGHKFIIHSLSANEQLAVAVLMKPWAGTIGESMAFTIASVAMSIVTVDGEALPVPFQAESDSISWARQRFDYVKSRWFMSTIDLVFAEKLVLDAKVREVLDEMGKASGWEPSTLDSNGDYELPIDEASSSDQT